MTVDHVVRVVEAVGEAERQLPSLVWAEAQLAEKIVVTKVRISGDKVYERDRVGTLNSRR